MIGTAGAVVTIGEALGVLRADGPGGLAQASALAIGTGGAEANVAIGVARLGGRAVWLGRIGRDGLGRRVRRELRAEGVETVTVDDPAPTGMLIKDTTAAGRTRVSYYRAGSAGSRISPEDVDLLDLKDAAVLHVTGITPPLSWTAEAAVDRAVELAVAAGVPVSFDVNHRSLLWGDRDARPVYRALAARASVLFAGVEEARLLVDGADGDSPEDLGRRLADEGHPEVVLKLGEHGALAVTDACVVHRAARPIRSIDTVGAGDAFAAGYLVRRVRGATLEDRLATAVECGTIACLSPGDWEGSAFPEDLFPPTEADPVRR